MRAALSECPHGLFHVPEAELPNQFKSLAVDHPPFSTEPAPPENDAQIEAILNDPSKRLPRGWEHQPDVIRVYRDALHAAAQQIPEYPGGSGRGIVICGGGKYWASAIITLHICRKVGIDLPVELWHLPGEITPGMRRYSEAMGITLREGKARGGWELKLHALVHSSFQEVLSLDSDSYPVQNVDDFWNSDGFKSTGFLMFPDRPSPLRPLGIEPGDRLKPHVFEAFGLPFIDTRSIEAGQMFVDRARHWKTLWLANWVCQHSNYFFKKIYGDKDVAWLCARLLKQPYYVMPTFWDHEGVALVHFDWRDRVRFVHRVHGKWDLYETGFTTTTQRQERRDQLPMEAEVWVIFEQLKKDMAEDIAAHAAKMRADRLRETVVKPDRPRDAKGCKTCGTKTTQGVLWDGSKFWKRLHDWTTAADITQPIAINQWVTDFIAEIPCDVCRIHAADYVLKNPPDCSSNLALCMWGWGWHDATSVNAGRPRFTFQQVAPQYGWDKLEIAADGA